MPRWRRTGRAGSSGAWAGTRWSSDNHPESGSTPAMMMMMIMIMMMYLTVGGILRDHAVKNILLVQRTRLIRHEHRADVLRGCCSCCCSSCCRLPCCCGLLPGMRPVAAVDVVGVVTHVQVVVVERVCGAHVARDTCLVATTHCRRSTCGRGSCWRTRSSTGSPQGRRTFHH